jgi:hypothetical protein
VGGDDGFKPLFNGKDLAGWERDGLSEGGWAVENGVIVARGDNYRTRNYLLTPSDYADFDLRLEFMPDQKASSAVALRAVPNENLPLRDGAMGFDHPLLKVRGKWGEEAMGTTHWVFARGMYVPPEREIEPKVGEWNQLTVSVRGRSLVATLNGEVVVRGEETEGATLNGGVIPALCRARGRIGLQRHTGTIRFRKIEVREIGEAAGRSGPPAQAAAEAPLGEIVYKDDFGDVNSGWHKNEMAVEGSITPFRRDFDSGIYFMEAPAKWTGFEAWNCTGPLDHEFQYEAVARSVGPEET